jgi:hypothetical protein
MTAEGFIWLAVGTYLVLVGCGRLPVPPGGAADWFEGASRERFRLALRPLGVGLIIVGVGLGFRLL